MKDFSLKPGQNATATLKKLFDVRTKPGAAPLEDHCSHVLEYGLDCKE